MALFWDAMSEACCSALCLRASSSAADASSRRRACVISSAAFALHACTTAPHMANRALHCLQRLTGSQRGSGLSKLSLVHLHALPCAWETDSRRAVSQAHANWSTSQSYLVKDRMALIPSHSATKHAKDKVLTAIAAHESMAGHLEGTLGALCVLPSAVLCLGALAFC